MTFTFFLVQYRDGWLFYSELCYTVVVCCNLRTPSSLLRGVSCRGSSRSRHTLLKYLCLWSFEILTIMFQCNGEKTQIREQMLVPDLYVFTLKFEIPLHTVIQIAVSCLVIIFDIWLFETSQLCLIFINKGQFLLKKIIQGQKGQKGQWRPTKASIAQNFKFLCYYHYSM